MSGPFPKFFVAASAIAFALAGCSGKQDNAASSSESASDPAALDGSLPTDAATPAVTGKLAADSSGAKFLTEALKGDNGEVKLGKLAAAQGGSDAVRQFGQMLASDHAKHAETVGALAASMGVARTEAASNEAEAAYNELKALKGDAFDSAFAKQMVDDHQKDIATYQAEAASKDPKALIDMANQTLPTLRKHLSVAQGL